MTEKVGFSVGLEPVEVGDDPDGASRPATPLSRLGRARTAVEAGPQLLTLVVRAVRPQ